MLVAKPLHQLLSEDLAICPAGAAVELERRGLAPDLTPTGILDHPEAFLDLHLEYLRAGADMVLAHTFDVHRVEVQKAAELDELVNLALRVAFEAARGRGVPIGAVLSAVQRFDDADEEGGEPDVALALERSRAVFERLAGLYRAGGQGEETSGGVDFVLAEGFQSLAEAKLAIAACAAQSLPVALVFAPYGERTMDGVSWAEACREAAAAGAICVGLGAARGPATLRPLFEELSGISAPLAWLPAAVRTTWEHPHLLNLVSTVGGGGIPAYPTALEPHLLARGELAAFALEAHGAGARLLGVGAGGSAQHLRALSLALGRTPLEERPGFGFI